MAHSGPKEKTVTITSSVTRIARSRAEHLGDRSADLADPLPPAVNSFDPERPSADSGILDLVLDDDLDPNVDVDGDVDV